MPKAFVISFSEETRLTRRVAFTAPTLCPSRESVARRILEGQGPVVTFVVGDGVTKQLKTQDLPIMFLSCLVEGILEEIWSGRLGWKRRDPSLVSQRSTDRRFIPLREWK